MCSGSTKTFVNADVNVTNLFLLRLRLQLKTLNRYPPVKPFRDEVQAHIRQVTSIIEIVFQLNLELLFKSYVSQGPRGGSDPAARIRPPVKINFYVLAGGGDVDVLPGPAGHRAERAAAAPAPGAPRGRPRAPRRARPRARPRRRGARTVI